MNGFLGSSAHKCSMLDDPSSSGAPRAALVRASTNPTDGRGSSGERRATLP